ncbi:uncharacterized protein PAC_16364 [Phialocephala subalpina]|uniref:Uncharacterized protein n=1 Tax=Phialocephala subalpina TaxID=576137 RepID=A0A1L7XN54_9HELO|nr:uncharacterized protein PAC_16364 [Phialocephala subalpina]
MKTRIRLSALRQGFYAWGERGLFQELVWSDDFRGRGRTFQAFVFEHLLAEVQGKEILLDIGCHDAGFDDSAFIGPIEDLTVDKFLGYIGQRLELLFKHTWAKRPRIQEIARLSFHLGMCYLLGIGTPKNNAEAMRWTTVAALGQYKIAFFLAPLIRLSCSGGDSVQISWELFLVVGALAGIEDCLNDLLSNYPAYYHATLKVLQTELPVDDDELETDFTFILQNYMFCEASSMSEMDIWDAIKTRNVDFALTLLTATGSVMENRSYSLLHQISVLEDKVAARLVRPLFKCGAKLDFESTNDANPMQALVGLKCMGTPLNWAVPRGMRILFKELLFVHTENSIPIRNLTLMVMSAALQHQPQIGVEPLKARRDFPLLFEDNVQNESLKELF